ncbi:MAG: hypothetical protein JST89_24200 [Cyanobacteria bacterium SZAS-4]|nr:hypothetical protein [Cyanobacteria bacterium SZAS-4]
MRGYHDSAAGLPPLSAGNKLKRMVEERLDQMIIYVGAEVSNDTVPSFIRDDPAFVAHLNSISNIQKQKSELQRYSRLQEVVSFDFRVEANSSTQDTPATEPAQCTHAVSATEPAQCTQAAPATGPTKTALSTEEQLELATKFLAKIEELLKTT